MKNFSKIYKNPLDNLLNQNDGEVLTRQTLQSLFRTMLEAILEEGNKAVVIFKLNDIDGFEGVLKRFSYSNSDIFSFSSNLTNSNFNFVEQNEINENTEFTVIVAERFSIMTVWGAIPSSNQPEYKTYVTFNSKDVLGTIEYLNAFSGGAIQTKIDEIKLDRRDNVQFNLVFNKLLSVVEGAQKDLLCANIELKDLQKQSDKYSRYFKIGKQASVIGHELRNQISILKLYSKVLNKNVEKSGCEQNIKNSFINAVSSMNKAIETVDTLLDDLKNYSTSINLNVSSADVVELVKSTIDLMLPAFNENGIKLAFEKSTEQMFSNVDETKFQQVLINLLKNTLEVDKNTQTTVNLATVENNIEINVIDNAQGISDELLDAIFEPNFTTKANGSGIGLALSKEIMKAHCGDLVLKETGKNGSTFSIYLPLSQNIPK